MTAAYSVRKVVPTYAGSFGRGRNNASTLFGIGFDADGIANQTSIQNAINAAGAGGFGWGDIYDQKNNHHFASTSRPGTSLSRISNRAGKAVPGINFNNKVQNMVTTTTPVDFSPGKHVAVFIVASTEGWSSAGAHARAPAVWSLANGPILGFGTTSAGAMVYGAYGPRGETTFRTGEGTTYVDASTPNADRVRNLWYRWHDGLLDGGIDTRVAFTDRPFPISITGPQRLVLGADGAVSQSHNGNIFELLLFCTDAPLSREECQRIALWQRLYWGDLANGRIPKRHRVYGAGQSNIQYYGTVASASTGLEADFAVNRVFRPGLASLIGADVDTTKELTVTMNTSAIGGSQLMPSAPMTPDAGGGTSWAVYDGNTASKKFWWDPHNNIPGPCAMTWRQNTVALYPGATYDTIVLPWGQGEACASILAGGETATYTYAMVEASLEALFNWFRTQCGQLVPILIQPLGRQSGTDASCRRIRKIQRDVAARMQRVHLSGDVCDLNRQDSVHFAAGPADPIGFDRAAIRLLRSTAKLMGVSGILDQSPQLTAARLVSATTIDLTVSYPEGAGGSDIAPAAGLVGFSVDGKVVSGAERIGPTTIRLTGSGFAVGDFVQHNQTPSALNRANMVVDNNPVVPMALRPAFDLPVAA